MLITGFKSPPLVLLRIQGGVFESFNCGVFVLISETCQLSVAVVHVTFIFLCIIDLYFLSYNLILEFQLLVSTTKMIFLTSLLGTMQA